MLNRLRAALAGSDEDLPDRIRALLAPMESPNVVVLEYIVRHLSRLKLSDGLRVACVMIVIEDILRMLGETNSISSSSSTRTMTESHVCSDIDTRLAAVPRELTLIVLRAVSLLHQRPVSTRDCAYIGRCVTMVLQPNPSKDDLGFVLHLLSTKCKQEDIDQLCPYAQECAMWLLWFFLQQPRFATSLNVAVVEGHLVHWKHLSCTLVSEWSASLPSVDKKLASRLTCQLIRLVSLCGIDPFKMLSVIKLRSPLSEAIECVSRYDFLRGLTSADQHSALTEYGAVLSYFSNLCVIRIEEMKKDLLLLADLGLQFVRCLIVIPEQSMEPALLLLRHIIYNRNVLSADKLPQLLALLCTLQECLPFHQPDHIVWRSEALAKVANNLAIALKDCKDTNQARQLEEIFISILCTLLPKFPTSKDCLVLLRLALMGVEASIRASRTYTGMLVSPRCVADILRLYGPHGVDPQILVACISCLRKQDAYLYEQLLLSDPDRARWLSLELYALLRIGAPDTAVMRVERELTNCVISDESLASVVSVLSLRVNALYCNREPVDTILEEHAGDNLLMKTARRGLWLTLRLRQLAEAIKHELSETREIMSELPKSNHEAAAATLRRELQDEIPLALRTLCFGNYAELFATLKWIFRGYLDLKNIDYGILLSSFVLDDLKLSATFLAINGDVANNWRILTIIDKLLNRCSAPKSVLLDNRLRIGEALILAGCTDHAQLVIESIASQLNDELPFYCEDFFMLRGRLDMLRTWVSIEKRDVSDLLSLPSMTSKPLPDMPVDKLRVHTFNRYYHAKALIDKGIIESGKKTAIDILDSVTRYLFASLGHLEKNAKELFLWEHLDVALPHLLTDCLKADVLFDIGSMKDTIALTIAACQESQLVFSLYFTLRHIERMTRVSTFLDRSIDSKMAIVMSILDEKRGPNAKNEKNTSDDVNDDKSFSIRTTDAIPYHSAMMLKMRQVYLANAERRVPPKEFLKFRKRHNHLVDCKCTVCYSLGIHVTLKKLDALSAYVTLENYKCSEGCAENRLKKQLSLLMHTCGITEFSEESLGLRAIGLKVKLQQAFSLAQGFALQGKYKKALKVLTDAEDVLQKVGDRHDRLEMELRKFEYTFSIDWTNALKCLGVPNNLPVPFVPECNDEFQTPAVMRKPVARPAPPRRKLPFPPELESLEGAGGGIKCEIPAKKARVADKTKRSTLTTLPTKTTTGVAVKTTSSSSSAATTTAAAATTATSITSRGVERDGTAANYAPAGAGVTLNTSKPTVQTACKVTSAKPMFKPFDENSKRQTRQRQAANVPRNGELNVPSNSIIDLPFDSLEEHFMKITLAERFKKPRDITATEAQQQFETFLNVARPCVPVGKQRLLRDLFIYLAFLSAVCGRKDEFQFYLERSFGLAVMLAGLNRGSRMADHFEASLLSPEYFDWLRPTVTFEKRWHEKIWEWCDPSWSIVQVSTLFKTNSTPDLIVTRYQCGCDPLTVHISAEHDGQFWHAFIKEFDAIILLNQVSFKTTERASYWQLRQDGDRRMNEFCKTIEEQWMGCWKGMFVGNLGPVEQKVVLDAVHHVRHWSEERHLPVDTALLTAGLSALPLLDHTQLLTLLFNVIKPSVCELLELNKLAHALEAIMTKGRLTSAAERSPVILVLDRNLINMPFDSCPLYNSQEVTRMPCVPLIAAQGVLLRRRNSDRSPKKAFMLADPLDGFYCINPGTDLKDTEKRFKLHMNILEDKWEGELGKPLTRDSFKKFLQSKSLYLYCGHGTGRQHMKEYIESINVRAAAMIMGCSSGKMHVHGSKMDIEGYVLRFLLGGSPAIVANLWDVTDRDIDYFTYVTLRLWLWKIWQGQRNDKTTNEKADADLEAIFASLDEPKCRLGVAVSIARSKCKLKGLIGAAPVIWGLPFLSYDNP